jgi:peptidoglycan/xylan/chitin deacetylase (PgdA/CDA1 family)
VTDEPIIGFEIADPDGTFLTLSLDEGRRMLAMLNHEAEDGEPLSELLEALRSQLSEWVDPNEGGNQ